jgi:hypothetical protein
MKRTFAVLAAAFLVMTACGGMAAAGDVEVGLVYV